MITRKSYLLDVRNEFASIANLVSNQIANSKLVNIIREYNSRNILHENNLFHKNTLLFSGPTGCGKTFAVHALANTLGLHVRSIDINTLIYESDFDHVHSCLTGSFIDSFETCIYFIEDHCISDDNSMDCENKYTLKFRAVLNIILDLFNKHFTDSILIVVSKNDYSIGKYLRLKFDDTLQFNHYSNGFIKLFEIYTKDEWFSNPSDMPDLVKMIEKDHHILTYSALYHICNNILKHTILFPNIKINEDIFLNIVHDKFR